MWSWLTIFIIIIRKLYNKVIFKIIVHCNFIVRLNEEVCCGNRFFLLLIIFFNLLKFNKIILFLLKHLRIHLFRLFQYWTQKNVYSFALIHWLLVKYYDSKLVFLLLFYFNQVFYYYLFFFLQVFLSSLFLSTPI